MEPTRVGQFDNEMYAFYCCNDEVVKTTFKPYWMFGLEREAKELEEKQIADSHDITKSNFGYESK